MDILKLHAYVALILFGGIQAACAQNAENGARLSQRWCSGCHAIGPSTSRSFAAIAAKETINADMIASFLLLPHATMPNAPLSRQDIALFIIGMKK